jgi:hypothetical protein
VRCREDEAGERFRGGRGKGGLDVRQRCREHVASRGCPAARAERGHDERHPDHLPQLRGEVAPGVVEHRLLTAARDQYRGDASALERRACDGHLRRGRRTARRTAEGDQKRESAGKLQQQAIEKGGEMIPDAGTDHGLAPVSVGDGLQMPPRRLACE